MYDLKRVYVVLLNVERRLHKDKVISEIFTYSSESSKSVLKKAIKQNRKMSQGRLPKLLELAKSLPEVEQRKVAAMVGACVGDAAARPMHWVYDMSALNSYLKNDGTGTDRTKNPEFFPENRQVITCNPLQCVVTFLSPVCMHNYTYYARFTLWQYLKKLIQLHGAALTPNIFNYMFHFQISILLLANW